MYTPEHKSKLYLVVVAAIALFIGWLVIGKFQPLVIERSCSEVAAGSSDILGERYGLQEYDFSFDTVKNECLSEFK